MGNYQVKRCGFCDTLLVAMNTGTGSVLPVEVSKGAVISDEVEFDSSKHTSHLLKCIPQRQAWNVNKWKYIKARNPFSEMKTLKERSK